jgi:hypothetical protein
VSRAAAKLDEGLAAWRERPLGEVPYLFLDACYEKVRLEGRIVDCAVLIASAVLRVAGAPERRREEVTVDEIVALADAATRAGTLLAEEQKLVTRVFELDERTVRTAMVPRDEIVYLLVGGGRGEHPQETAQPSARQVSRVRRLARPARGLRRYA